MYMLNHYLLSSRRKHACFGALRESVVSVRVSLGFRVQVGVVAVRLVCACVRVCMCACVRVFGHDA